VKRTATFVLLLSIACARRAEPCSICRCGDATFNALGPQVYSAGAFRLALDWERFDKSNGASPEGEGDRRSLDVPARDHEIEQRFTATVSYSFGESVNAVARLPWSSRRLTEGDALETRTSDLSDPEVYALVRLYASRLSAGVGRRAWVSALVGVKTPWGRNDVRGGDGARLDEHAQPGTGSTDVFGGLAALYVLDPSSSLFGSFQLRRAGTNSFDYRYGDVAQLSAAYEHKLGGAVDAVLELDYRHQRQDRVDAGGRDDPNTGGDILYVSPRVMVDVGRGLVVRAGVQVPVVRALYGDQTERVVVNAGLTYLF
jgi:hypothetical protein